MEKVGELLGWLAAVCYFAAVANLVVKRLYQVRIAKLPKDNAFRRGYQFLMQRIVRYHRYFGVGAGVFALCHLCWQLVNVRLSYSGVLVTALMTATALMGILILKGKKKDLVKVHRPLALTVLAVILFHMITKL